MIPNLLVRYRTLSPYPVEFGLLLALAFVLPLFEVVKNLFWFLYALTWVANRVQARDFGGRWVLWDTLFAGLFASALLSAAFAGIHGGGEWKGAFDVLRFVSLGFLVRRAGYDHSAKIVVLLTVLGGTLIALGQGLWLYKIAAAKPALELRSVGQVNQSAAYLVMAYAVTLGLAFGFGRQLGVLGRLLIALTLALLVSGILISGSRGAALAMLVITTALAWFYWRSARRLAWLALGAMTATVLLAQWARFSVVERQQAFVTQGSITSLRSEIWRVSWIAFQRYPLLGVGNNNHPRLTRELVSEWLGRDASDALPVDAAILRTWPIEAVDGIRFANHAHNLYINAAVERGSLGLLALLSLLAAVAWPLLRARPDVHSDPAQAALHGAALGLVGVVAVAGLGNSTLHHELGLLFMLGLGLWLAPPPGPRTAP